MAEGESPAQSTATLDLKSSSTVSGCREMVQGMVEVVKCMEMRHYTIPQYPVYKVELLHVIVKADDGSEVDAFMEIRDQSASDIPGYIFVENGFFLRYDETAGQLGGALELTCCDEGIFMIADWVSGEPSAIPETPQPSPSVSPTPEHTVQTPPLFTSSDDTDSDTHDESDQKPEATGSSPQLHTVPFKAMGTTKINGAQDVLRKVRDTLRSGGSVPVVAVPEPDNPVDRNAIAFKCMISGRWHKFGYAVTEVAEELLFALQSSLVAHVAFKDVRFVCIWSRSSPGFYAAVNITKHGMWSSRVTRAASTF